MIFIFVTIVVDISYKNSVIINPTKILGTASVALAGILGAIKVTQTKLEDNTFLFYGAGEVTKADFTMYIYISTKSHYKIEFLFIMNRQTLELPI